MRILLGLLGAAAGALTGSLALAAEGARSALQSASGLLRPNRPDAVGTDRIGRASSSVWLSVLLPIAAAVIGFELAWTAVRTVWAGTGGVTHWAAVLAVPLLWAGRALIAPKGSDRALDACTAALVMTGAGAAWYGGYAGAAILLPLDEAAGCAIGLFTAVQGCRTAVRLIGARTRTEMARAELAAMEEVVRRIDGIIEVESLRGWEQGHYAAVNVSVLVNPYITMQEGQEIGRRAKERLLRLFGHVMDVRVQVEPYDKGFPYKTNVDPKQERVTTLLQ